MSDIYEQHKKSFPQVSAYVLIDKAGDRVATIAFKFPKDGAGRLYCYLHVLGLSMVRGHANGYGYDKSSAAAWSAVQKIPPVVNSDNDFQAVISENVKRIHAALKKADSGTWNRELEIAGYHVYQAV